MLFLISMLAALLRALFFAFQRLQRYCEHCFLRFSACSVTASIKTLVFTFAERRYVFGMVGAAPACPPERSRSGVSIIKTHALCAGDERRMRPCRATRAGTQAPPLPISIIFFHTIPYKQNNHLRAIPHKRNQPSTHNPAQTKHINNLHPQQSGAEMHRALPPPQL